MLELIQVWVLWGIFPVVVCIGIIYGWIVMYEITVYSLGEFITYLKFFPVLCVIAFIVAIVYNFSPAGW